MAADPETCRVTTVLVENIHCASCSSHIKDVLSSSAKDVVEVNVNVLSRMVEIRHGKSLAANDICDQLIKEAFDVSSAETQDDHKNIIDAMEFDGPAGWLEVGLEKLNQAWTKPNANRCLTPNNFGLDRKTRHIQNCDACRKDYLPPANPANGQLQRNKTEHSSHLQTPSKHGDEEEGPRRNAAQLDPPAQQRLVTLMIEGMTCAACVNSVTRAIRTLDQVSHVEVNLMTNSALVEYTGSKEEAGLIVEAAEDAGFDASVQESREGSLEDSKKSRNRYSGQTAISDAGTERSVALRIDGMFCDHCPPRVIEALSLKFPSDLTIEQAPSLKTPIISLTYMPAQRSFTIRDIIATVNDIHEKINAHVHQPPSLEERSQAMHAQEQRRLLKRLSLCFIVLIPTLLIGVVYMSVVPASNSTRQWFEQPVWKGAVTRAQWALFIVATPVMFFAADIFHLRAFKEIRALWRPKSQVPILRRFYRFGSMNLLISAGTSVAYFSSLGLLIQAATMDAHSPNSMANYFDTVPFLTFFILSGKYLEAYSKARTGNAVAMLGKLRPQEATLVVSNPKEDDSNPSTTRKIGVDLLEIGDIVIVSHGSSPPADGIIMTGSSKFNESSLTGESRDVNKKEGDQVFAGTINTGDPVQVEVTGLGGTSMLDRIISVVREGQTKRAPVERVVDTVTGYFVPVITALAIITFLTWFGLGQSGLLSPKYLQNQQGGWAIWSLQFAIAVFVVACPCGIGLAAPTALFVGGGLAARSGILVRGGGEAFQEASRVDAVVFDKTGTLTEGGNPTVTDHHVLIEDDKSNLIWSMTASLEETSSHPLARALLHHASTFSRLPIATISITEEAGHGLRGNFTSTATSGIGTTYEAAIGSEAYIASLQPSLLDYFTTTTLSKWQSQSKSIALLALREVPSTSSDTTTHASASEPWTLAAMFAISDPIRATAIPTIAALQSRGIPVYMLTGDNPTTASAVASTLSIPADHVFAGVLPTQKAEKIDWLKEHAPRRRTTSSWMANLLRRCRRGTNDTINDRKAIIAFIGDGINDAPALAAASVSVAISSSSSSSGPANDVAVNSASFILLSSSLLTLLTLFDLSRVVFRRIKFNFVWAMVYNVVLVPVAAGALFAVREGGWRLGPVWGSAAMAGSSLSVVGSSLALGWGWRGYKEKEKERG